MKNADEEQRKTAKQTVNALTGIVDKLSKNGKRRRHFSSRKDFKRFKKVRKQLRKAKRDLRKFSKASKITANRIQEIKTKTPNLFSKMDNLENKYGETVDLYISTSSNITGDNDGATIHGFDKEGEMIRPISNYGLNSIEVEMVNNPSGGRSTLTVSKHEAGHAIYQGENTKAYYHYLQRTGRPAGATSE